MEINELKDYVYYSEKNLIEYILELTKGNQVLTSVILNINRNTLRKRLIKYEISYKDFKKGKLHEV